MNGRIQQLEERARILEPDAAARARLQEAVRAHVQQFLEQLPGAPAYRAPADENLGDLAVTEEPVGLEAALRLLTEHVDHNGVAMNGGHMAYIPGSSLYAAALGDYLAAVTNRYVGISFAAPGAVRIERELLRWLADVVGYPAGAGGDLTSGGSIANLVAVVTAREAHEVKAVDIPRTVVYLSEQTHHSVAKALRIAGLKEAIVRRVPLDEGYRMRPAALAEMVEQDRAAGRLPWLIVAAAGSTDTGAVDPLDALAEIAAVQGLWLHVDGAYGAAFALCEPGKKVLQGIERSDSLVLDGHKGLFLPFGSGAVLVRNREHLLQAHQYSANYMQDARALAWDEIDPSDLSPELSRPFRGLRLWLPLKLVGVAPFRAALEEKLLLARAFYERIREMEGFVAGPPPDLSIVTFRYVPPRGDADAFNQKLLRALQQDGRILLSSTRLDGRFTLRLVVLGLQTHQETVDLALKLLQEKAAALLEGEGTGLAGC